jgi:hypothetical protein
MIRAAERDQNVSEPASDWKAGDRVAVVLPYRSGVWGRYRRVRATGTVTAVDVPGLPPGVDIALDFEVGGARSCYATHEEVMSADP